MLEYIFSVDYFFKDDHYPCWWYKLLLKKNMINEDKWESSTNRKMVYFLINDQFYFVRPPYEKYQKFEKCQTFNFDECSDLFLIHPFLS